MKKYLLLLFFPLSFISLGAKDNSELIKKADRIIALHKLYKVMHKTQIPPSGDKHDYMSQGPIGGQTLANQMENPTSEKMVLKIPK